jgi:hypothetical protein
MKPVWSAEITSVIVVSRRRARVLARIFTSLFRREMGRYEPHSVFSLPGLSRRIIDASVSVCGNDPRDIESINISKRIGDSFLEKVLKNYIG